MPLIHLVDSALADPRLAPFSRMTDAELRDPHQLVGLARAIDAQETHLTSMRDEAHAKASADASANFDACASSITGADPNRLSSGLFIGESRNVIERALAAGIKPFALLIEECWLDATRSLVTRLLDANPALPAFVATREQMRALTGFERTRGALAAFHRPPLPHPRDLLKGARRVAVLEDITNYTNVGAIFRSAAALGIDAVLVTPACHDPLYRRAARVSMGTVFQVPWTRIGDDATPASITHPTRHAETPACLAHEACHVEALTSTAAPACHAKTSAGTTTEARHMRNPRKAGNAEEPPVRNLGERKPRSAANGEKPTSWATTGIPLLRELGFTTCALALSDDSIPLHDKRLQACDKLALVLGTEGDGLAERTIAACDYTVRIPMDHGVDSLNVAAASAVAFWELRVNHRD